MAEWRVQLVAGGTALALALGGARVADRVLNPGPCRAAGDFASPTFRPPKTGEQAAAWLLGTARFPYSPPPAAIAPLPVQESMAVPVGHAAHWDVAVLQLPTEPRTLTVDYGDGGDLTATPIPAGTGACVVRLHRTYREPAQQVAVTFLVASTGDAGKDATEAAAVVDVVAGR